LVLGSLRQRNRLLEGICPSKACDWTNRSDEPLETVDVGSSDLPEQQIETPNISQSNTSLRLLVVCRRHGVTNLKVSCSNLTLGYSFSLRFFHSAFFFAFFIYLPVTTLQDEIDKKRVGRR
jgi:hypothetical protein